VAGAERSIRSVTGRKNMNITEEFKKVRDIPYRIPLAPGESDDCCSGKSNRLFGIFKKAGYDVRYRVCTFRWSDMKLPVELQQMSHEDECTHSYLEVKTGDEWVTVDATWDKGLKEAFDVNEWDGKSDTKVAVPIIECFSPEKSTEIMEKDASEEAVKEDLQKNGEFYKGFNDWLAEIRIKSVRASQ